MSAYRLTCLISCLCLSWLSVDVSANTTESLLQSIHQRLALMRDVAAYKWIHKLPIEDLAREKVVVDAASRGALQHGITPNSSNRFFRVQISAAKEIQEYWFSQWSNDNAPREAPDLIGEIRPLLIQLGDTILAQLPIAHEIYGENLAGNLVVEGLGEDTRQALLDALGNIRLYPDRLTQILDSRQLRVGTTGDYPPFSVSQNTQDETVYSGIDIQLAHDLAQHLDVNPIFVPTTWPTLMHDLDAGFFDIAMSGVSLTQSRKKSAYFSTAYLSGGKTPIVRCEDVGRFNTLKKIDQPAVRLIVNPGGTNERFVESNIHHARIERFNDNRSIFLQIIRKEADVMITDRIEVTHQSALHPELCPAMKGNLNVQKKAYLMPQDKKLKVAVDAWLALGATQGMISALFNPEPGAKRGAVQN